MIDRNQLTGILLIMAMLLSWQFFMSPTEQEVDPKKAQFTADSLKKVQAAKKIVATQIPSNTDTSKIVAATAQDFVLENKDIKVTLSSLGGAIKKVELKNYKTYQNFEAKKNIPLVIFNEGDKLGFEMTNPKGSTDFSKVNFSAIKEKNKITFSTNSTDNQIISQAYTLPENGFVVDYKLNLPATATQAVKFNWIENVKQSEKDIVDNRTKSTVNYLDSEDEFDWLSENPSAVEEEKLELPLKFLAFKKKYFLSGFVPNALITNAEIMSAAQPEDSLNIKILSAKFSLPADALKNNKGNIKLYFGPNDSKYLKPVADGFDRNVYLGYEIFKPINKYVFVPLFNFLEKIFSNYGLLILVLVLIIKVALTPLTYKSYVGMAKMKLLQPELEALKAKIGDDAAKMQQEQMKLYGQVGVSPMSGCVPVLATMPILMSVFFLFPNLFELRQQPFLWANDLSTFDSIIKLPFNIPFYGAHISIFTLLMTVSSLAYGYYNNQITPAQTGQPFDMRMMAYVTPVIFMFVMNSFPAGLSFYYFVSNIITVAQQLIIRKFVDNDKLRDILEENRKKIAAGGGPKKSKFSEYLQKSMAAAEDAKKQQDAAKAKSKKK
ncbi:MAG: membrane protein insertase YidC [Bacteroidota bacterium]